MPCMKEPMGYLSMQANLVQQPLIQQQSGLYIGLRMNGWASSHESDGGRHIAFRLWTTALV